MKCLLFAQKIFDAHSQAHQQSRVRDQESLLNMILGSLSRSPGLCEGVGQLMFEVCRGVPRQFHSCCEAVLTLLLRKLGSSELPTERVFRSVTKMVELMATHTRREFSGPVWRPLLVREFVVEPTVKYREPSLSVILAPGLGA